MKIFFFEHDYFRDRQLDTISRLTRDSRYQIQNEDILIKRTGGQVSRTQANSKKIKKSLKQRIPLVNIKRRPSKAASESIIYVWGGLILTGKFIVDLDNPWSLTGFNLRAMSIYKPIIRKILLSNRCLEIRCLSKACRESLGLIFGKDVYRKAKVEYPLIKTSFSEENIKVDDKCRFLFVGTQFEIKGGPSLINAFSKVHSNFPNTSLDIISHIPDDFQLVINRTPGILAHEASFTREEILSKFILKSDVLILPTFVESFGMVVMEAIANGLAVITTDVYALGEMVDSTNGFLISPPISIWQENLPSRFYWDIENIKKHISETDKKLFEIQLENAMIQFAKDKNFRETSRVNSLKKFQAISECTYQ